ncbi:MAG: hypothetical protein ACT4PW_06715 [Acidimicrobiia bacterium]
MAETAHVRQIRERMEAAAGRVRAALPAEADTTALAQAIRDRDAQKSREEAEAFGVGDRTLAALGELLKESMDFAFSTAADLVAQRWSDE